MNFAQRLQLARAFETEVEQYLLSRALMVAKNGTEHTHPFFTDKIRSNLDAGAKFVRFAPDGVYLNKSGSVIHWEAKAGKNIEKDAYENYMIYYNIGCTVVLFVRADYVYCQLIERIEFIPSESVVNRYPPNRRHPICENGWIYPRHGHGFAGFGSGTPYKEIDLSSMLPIPDWVDPQSFCKSSLSSQ